MLNEKDTTMTIKIKNTEDPRKQAKFMYNEQLTECQVLEIGVSEEEMSYILENKGHEGAEIKGWETEIL
jgi:hypothetical protein